MLTDFWVAMTAGVAAPLAIWVASRIALAPRLRFSAGIVRRDMLRPHRTIWNLKYQNSSFWREINDVTMTAVVVVPTALPMIVRPDAQGAERTRLTRTERRTAIRIALAMTNDAALRLPPRSSRLGTIQVQTIKPYLLERLHDMQLDFEYAAEQGTDTLSAEIVDGYRRDAQAVDRIRSAAQNGTLQLERLLDLNLSGDPERETYLTVSAICSDSFTGRELTRVSPRYVRASIDANGAFARRSESVQARFLRATVTRAANWYSSWRRSFHQLPFEGDGAFDQD